MVRYLASVLAVVICRSALGDGRQWRVVSTAPRQRLSSLHTGDTSAARTDIGELANADSCAGFGDRCG